MSASLSHQASAEPNLTPILDLVFQLITFFMLVINFSAASTDLNLKLPILGSARPVDTKGQVDVLVLNIDAQGRLRAYGNEQEIDSYIESEAQATLLSARRMQPDLNPGDTLPTTVVIRADRATPFSLLNKVITTCQQHGFRRLVLKAMQTEA